MRLLYRYGSFEINQNGSPFTTYHFWVVNLPLLRTSPEHVLGGSRGGPEGSGRVGKGQKRCQNGVFSACHPLLGEWPIFGVHLLRFPKMYRPGNGLRTVRVGTPAHHTAGGESEFSKKIKERGIPLCHTTYQYHSKTIKKGSNTGMIPVK